MLNDKKSFFFYFKKRPGYKLIYNLSGQGERYYKKTRQKALKFGTQGRKNKVSKRQIGWRGSNKVPSLDKSPLDKSPPTGRSAGISCATF